IPSIASQAQYPSFAMSFKSLARPALAAPRLCTACKQQTRNASKLKSESTSWIFNTVPVKKQLTPRQREFLERAVRLPPLLLLPLFNFLFPPLYKHKLTISPHLQIRVNQAGELGANLIYAGQ